jgi:anti-anti-sigma regulatory factor
MNVKLPAEVTLSHVAEIREMLLTALHSREPLELDGHSVTDVDMAGLQLLCSLHRGTVQQGTTVAFIGGQRGDVIERAQVKAGFLRHVGCAEGCLWKGKGRG